MTLLHLHCVLLRSVYTVYCAFAEGDMAVYLENAIGANNIPVNRIKLNE